MGGQRWLDDQRSLRAFWQEKKGSRVFILIYIVVLTYCLSAKGYLGMYNPSHHIFCFFLPMSAYYPVAEFLL